jgi:Protein of unknown function (DUF3800)
MVDLPRTNLVAFIDESGDFELRNINPAYPVCAQCALTCTIDDYLADAVPNLMNIKYSFFGNECIVFHGHKIRKQGPPFDILRHGKTKLEFISAIEWALSNLRGCFIVAAVHKQRHVEQYINPHNPFFLSLQFLLERLYAHWEKEMLSGERLLCVFEARGKVEDRRTREWFEAICNGRNYRGRNFAFDIDFREKGQNVIGHQYADLVAYAACKYVQTGDEERADWKAIKGKLRAVNGQYLGHGLKIFP